MSSLDLVDAAVSWAFAWDLLTSGVAWAAGAAWASPNASAEARMPDATIDQPDCASFIVGVLHGPVRRGRDVHEPALRLSPSPPSRQSLGADLRRLEERPTFDDLAERGFVGRQPARRVGGTQDEQARLPSDDP